MSTESELSYPYMWRLPNIAIWRPMLAIPIAIVAYFGLNFCLIGIGIVLDPPANLTSGQLTPGLFLANNMFLAGLIPISLLISCWPIRQNMRFMSSVLGRIRWRWLIKCVLIALPIWAVSTGFDIWISWNSLDLRPRPYTIFIIVTILLTQVFQCTGEEFGFRGVVFRGVAALFPNEIVGVVIGALSSALLFMFAHGAGDYWLNGYYFTFGICMSYLVWRTGGLEASIALHCVNNMFGMMLLPFQDISNVFNREQGTGSPEMLVPMGIIVMVTLLLVVLAKRDGIARTVQVSDCPLVIETK